MSFFHRDHDVNDQISGPFAVKPPLLQQWPFKDDVFTYNHQHQHLCHLSINTLTGEKHEKGDQRKRLPQH